MGFWFIKISLGWVLMIDPGQLGCHPAAGGFDKVDRRILLVITSGIFLNADKFNP